MKQREHRESDEPVGIVIASGVRGEVTPRFSAFVWGPVPDLADDESEPVLEAKAA